MEEKEFIIFWKKLPHAKRKTIVEKSYLPLRKRAEDQLQRAKRKENELQSSDLADLFFVTTINSFWENCDFLFALGKNKWKNKTPFIIRPIMELTGKLGYFAQQTRLKQKELARVELLNALKKEYEYTIKNSKRKDDKKFLENLKDTYSKFKINDNPDITVNMKQFRQFSSISGFPPDMSRCFKEGKLVEPELFYAFFDRSSSLLHGNFFSHLTHEIHGGSDVINFIIDAQNALFCASAILKITDALINGKVSEETVNSIREFEAIHKAGIQN